MMECCMREKKLGDVVWTGRIESVTCLRSLPGQQQVLSVLVKYQTKPTICRRTKNNELDKNREHFLCAKQTQLRGVWRMLDHRSLVTKV